MSQYQAGPRLRASPVQGDGANRRMLGCGAVGSRGPGGMWTRLVFGALPFTAGGALLKGGLVQGGVGASRVAALPAMASCRGPHLHGLQGLAGPSHTMGSGGTSGTEAPLQRERCVGKRSAGGSDVWTTCGMLPRRHTRSRSRGPAWLSWPGGLRHIRAACPEAEPSVVQGRGTDAQAPTRHV